MLNIPAFILYVVATTFTPGPNTLLAMSHAMQVGYARTFGFLAGAATGFLVVMLACGWLNVALVGLLPQVRFWLELLGAAYMLFLAVHTLRSKPAAEGSTPGGLNSFRGGFTLQFLNLKLILYGISVYSLFITPAFQDPLHVALFAPLLALLGFTATSTWALGGSAFRNLWRKYYRVFNFVMAGFLIYSAVAGLLS